MNIREIKIARRRDISLMVVIAGSNMVCSTATIWLLAIKRIYNLPGQSLRVAASTCVVHSTTRIIGQKCAAQHDRSYKEPALFRSLRYINV